MTSFIRNRSLSRRSFLRGSGVALALPLLDAMIPAVVSRSGGRTGAAAAHGGHRNQPGHSSAVLFPESEPAGTMS